MQRPILKPTPIHRISNAACSSSERPSGTRPANAAAPAPSPGNGVVDDMIHKLSRRMNSAQLDVHLLVDEMDEARDDNRVARPFATPRRKTEKTRPNPPISNIDSISVPSSRSSSISSGTGLPSSSANHLPASAVANCNNNNSNDVKTEDDAGDRVAGASLDAISNGLLLDQRNGVRNGLHSPQRNIHPTFPVASFVARSGSNVETVYKNYEMLVTRLCSLESTIQSLKLKLASKEAMSECKGCSYKSDRMNRLNESYEKDLQELRGQVLQAKAEIQNERVLRQSAEMRVKHAESMLDTNNSDKVELSEKLSSMNDDVINLRQMVSEAGREVEAERTIRMKLEESHALLLKRIQEMDSAVDSERKTVSSLSVEAIELRKKTTSMDQQMNKSAQERKRLEEALARSEAEARTKVDDLLKSEAEKSRMVDQLKAVQSETDDLLERVREAEERVEDQSRVIRDLETERDELKGRAGASSDETNRIKYENRNFRGKIEELNAKNVEMLQELECLKQSESSLRKENDNKNADVENLRKSFSKLNGELKKAVTSKEDLEKNAQSILKKLDQKAEAVQKEKARLEKALEDKSEELNELRNENEEMRGELSSLRERISSLQQQDVSQDQLRSLMDRCSQLSYEKGELESQVDQFREKLEDFESVKMEKEILENEKDDTAKKLYFLEREIKTIRENCEQLQQQLLVTQQGAEQKERDFELALRSRDDALAQISDLADALEKKESESEKTISDLRTELLDVKNDNAKLAATLEKTVGSHSHLQSTIEELKRELGRKDAALVQKEEDISNKNENEARLKQKYIEVKSEMDNLQYSNNVEMDALKREIRIMVADNQKLASSLQLMIGANDELRASADCSSREMENLQLQLEKAFQERSSQESSQRVEFDNKLNKAEKDKEAHLAKLKRKHEKELNEIKAENSKLASRCVELRKSGDANIEEIEKLKCNIQVQKDKLASQRTQIRELIELKDKYESALDANAKLEQELGNAERNRRLLEKEAKDQALKTSRAYEEASRLQNDLSCFTDHQEKSTALIEAQKEAVAKEKEKYLSLKAKYKVLRKREKELTALNRDTAEKLQYAHDESLQVSIHLKQAGDWFKTRFDELQKELVEAQQLKDSLERERTQDKMSISAEKLKMDHVMGQASAMIAASRVAVSRLTQEAEANQQHARRQIVAMQNKMRKEAERAKAMEEKYLNLRESSSKHVETLAKELEAVKGDPVEEMVNEFETMLSQRQSRSRDFQLNSAPSFSTKTSRSKRSLRQRREMLNSPSPTGPSSDEEFGSEL